MDAESVLKTIASMGNSPESQIAKKYLETKKRLDPKILVDLFNSKLSPILRPCPSFFLPSGLIDDFVVLSSHKEMSTREDWDAFFEIVKSSNFLMNEFKPSLSWLIKPENAFKVLSGQYVNKEDKSANKAELSIKSHKLFDAIIYHGHYGLRELLKTLSQDELKALDKFGPCSQILNCSSFDSENMKRKLAECFKTTMPQ